MDERFSKHSYELRIYLLLGVLLHEFFSPTIILGIYILL